MKGEGQSLLRAAGAGLARLCSPIEGLWFGNEGPRCPPLFIAGLPRGGTTLVYQAVCSALEVGFPPSLANAAPFAPTLAARLCRLASLTHASDFRSEYGRAPGLASPGEGVVWNLWFEPDRHYDSASELDPRARRELVRFVGRGERVAGRPFVNKNVRHDHRLPALAEVFPTALFVVVLRSPLEVAFSLLRARQARGGDLREWFSIRPRSFPALTSCEPAEQVVGQVRGILDDLRESLSRAPAERVACVDYARFCATPERCIDDLVALYATQHHTVRRRGALPASFPVAAEDVEGLDVATVAAVRNACAEAFPSQAVPSFPFAYLGA